MLKIPLLVKLLLITMEVILFIYLFSIILLLVFNLVKNNILKINSTIFEENYASNGSIIYAY